MLRGKGASDWTKHWVVLAGLSLKLYKYVNFKVFFESTEFEIL